MTAAKTILILGSGIGGIVAASLLRKQLARKHRIILVEREPRHVFPPSLLWLMIGARREEQISRPIERLARSGIEFVHSELERIEPQTLRRRRGVACRGRPKAALRAGHHENHRAAHQSAGRTRRVQLRDGQWREPHRSCPYSVVRVAPEWPQGALHADRRPARYIAVDGGAVGTTRFAQHSRIFQGTGALCRRPIDARSYRASHLKDVCRPARSDAVQTLFTWNDPKRSIEGSYARQSNVRRRASEVLMVAAKVDTVVVF